MKKVTSKRLTYSLLHCIQLKGVPFEYYARAGKFTGTTPENSLSAQLEPTKSSTSQTRTPQEWFRAIFRKILKSSGPTLVRLDSSGEVLSLTQSLGALCVGESKNRKIRPNRSLR